MFDLEAATARRRTAWLGVLALLVNIVLPLGQQAWAGDGARGMVICTVYGTMPLDDRDGDGPPIAASTADCPVCLSYSAAAVAAHGAGDLPPPLVAPSALIAPTVAGPLGGRSVLMRPARAPPPVA